MGLVQTTCWTNASKVGVFNRRLSWSSKGKVGIGLHLDPAQAQLLPCIPGTRLSKEANPP